MILVIDVGNSHTVIGVYKEEKLLGHWRISTNLKKTEDEYGILVKGLLDNSKLSLADIKGIVISCVVPPIIWILKKMSADYFKVSPIIVGPGIKTGIYIKTDNPKEVGADRIVNAIAAYKLYGGPVIIIDFGTATTFCAVNKDGVYLGGAIAPGIEISAEALAEKTAKLPKIEVTKPQHSIGSNTIAAMKSGIFFGYLGLTNELIRRFKRELGEDSLVVATGGYSELIGNECNLIDKINPFLTLIGLYLVYEMNK
ncbi:MAG: type III pantothenate kinase [bacterium]|uniref:Type III pantothenate kinase n=1 Tax=Candidatus Infernicultor aquiphilus TaxID=1805029 RepID=A0A1J5GTE7_9BACT|nr:type III pantothenate kinase [bacterium]OIP72866.1 MAG: pantothenate kinase [Candidatus Atribacteria bacterium CG2_30_33_13]PIU24967.1 MAG: pantothenate kinase [Candidatus Atribacteria bacterium CG08_land_8_20_14_0_20_33_29]PIW12265.1 MAG: pantothenate kinase [Candidatus Atribacteria bacterium CG17_big_fil_post_rev_8_21_14_2_50_34_11]PIX33931.1 MAG: pantothenate kinase [Candidatus Atribacteria bacterium CG_4_8_14_3_um_filter_34_18]PJB56852.1 MAG: pantothenate kinase [Candidatus Atribacteria